MLKQHFIVEGKYLGQRPRAFERRGLAVVAPRSQSFFCTTCGRNWASCPVENEHGRVSTWDVMHVTCAKCPPHQFASHPTGLLTSHYDAKAAQDLPDDVVRWEFQRYMDFL